MFRAQPPGASLAATATAWRQRSLGRLTVRAFALAAIIVVLAVTAVNALRPTNRIDVASPAATESPSPTETADAAPASKEPLTADTPLDLYGIGPIEVGMTLAEAEAAAGVAFDAPGFDHFGGHCYYATAKGLEDDFVMTVQAPGSEPVDKPEDGIVVYVSVHHGMESPARTLSGIGIGSTEAEVYDTYAGRIESAPHEIFEDGHYLTLVPRDASDQEYGVMFATDGQVVRDIHAGFAEDIRAVDVEGCA